MTELVLRNRQRIRAVNAPLLRRVASVLLTDQLSLGRCELAIHLVAAPEMARVNQQFLDHAGSTDVITFDYGGEAESLGKGVGRGSARMPEQVHGEILICIDAAVNQARQFRTTWQSELVRYLIHGVLHLVGYDDLSTADRRVMKREENRLLRMISRQFSLKNLASAPPKSQIGIRKSQIRSACVSLSKPARATRVRS